MTDQPARREAVELLQQLGLKEYEARCFVALSRLPSATAKEISERSGVPRTRVYNAARVLESKGLVEARHASPKRYRAIAVDEATDLLRDEYQSLTDSLREDLRSIDPVESDEGSDPHQTVWTLSNAPAITNRMRRLVEGAEDEVVLLVGREGEVAEPLRRTLRDAHGRGVSVVVGATTDALRRSFEDCRDVDTISLRDTWIEQSAAAGTDAEIGRVLLVDRETVLITTVHADGRGERREEAVFCQGSANGVATIVRRAVLALLPADDVAAVAQQSGVS
ncbi:MULTISPECIES: TrmB family transcriptional regulator [unclassified Halorubrum]|uniref:TrmB family transcriptional regulator n=1 Tax=unclassified Halorubrum TaxID=2642239 RepID=UPI0003DB85AA|nr:MULTISPECIES: helix-turn-helix domain-containing protein [unclassified Halorubrum]CDK40733.1 transcriptional regulator, TrmB [Halorubrum sp. AJ67]